MGLPAEVAGQRAGMLPAHCGQSTAEGAVGWCGSERPCVAWVLDVVGALAMMYSDTITSSWILSHRPPESRPPLRAGANASI